MYNWEFKDWPNFTYDKEKINSLSKKFAIKIGELNGVAKGISEQEIQKNIIHQMISEALKTSEIEGEFFSREDVMSSIRNNLGVNKKLQKVKNPKADGVGKLVVEIRKNYSKKLSAKLIQDWHFLLLENFNNIKSGKWRKGKSPMQIISGAIGKEKVHFVAPPSGILSQEMKSFVNWYNDFKIDSHDFENILIKTSVSHLYFESIHPFEDGNGRIGRAIAEKCLFQELGFALPISLSTVIEKNKKKYYQKLNKNSLTLEITDWIVYFSEIILKSLDEAQENILFIINKTKFFDRFENQINERQKKVILKMMDFGAENFQGGMSAKKYMSIAKTSKATATRDLQDLFTKGIFSVSGQGRNVNYKLNF